MRRELFVQFGYLLLFIQAGKLKLYVLQGLSSMRREKMEKMEQFLEVCMVVKVHETRCSLKRKGRGEFRLDIILKWSSGQKHPMVSLECSEKLKELGVIVFKPMGLVDDQHFPVRLFKDGI